MSSKLRAARTVSVRKRKTVSASSQGILLRAAVLSFLTGGGCCTALLLLFAWLLSNTAIPLLMVRPFACGAAACGAVVSGFFLARKMSRQYLLCGLGCGIFYAVCQWVAAFISTGSWLQQGSDLMLPAALLMGGVLGGTLAALKGGR